jgi:hypothetical protein
MLADAGINGVTDAALTGIIEPCNGSARDIVTAITSLVLAVKRRQTAAQQTVV